MIKLPPASETLNQIPAPITEQATNVLKWLFILPLTAVLIGLFLVRA